MRTHTIIVDPRTGTPLRRRSLQSLEAVSAAVVRARCALEKWSTLAIADRCRILARAADLIQRDADSLAQELLEEQGKPWAEAWAEITKTAGVFRHFSAEPEQDAIPSGVTGSRVDWEPVGVVAAIVPNNYPATLAAYKCAPALAAGCAVIVKPDLQTAAVTEHLTRLLLQAGVPDGVIQIAYCVNDVAEHALVRNPGLDAVSFTGSARVGIALAAQSQGRGRPARVTLELGGVNSLIVEPDSNIDTTVEAALTKAFRNAGQVCHGISSVFIHEAIRDEWTAKFIDRAQDLRPVTEDRTENSNEVMGPLATQAARDRIKGDVERWRAAGAAIYQGENFRGAGGWFYPPTVVCPPGTGADPGGEQELFGPAVIVTTYRELASVIDRVNARSSGLVTYLYGCDSSVLAEQAKRLQCGSVGLNTTRVVDPRIPFGGWKASGLGTELGPHAVRAFQRPRHICWKRCAC